jgi:hypothetical protein
MTAAIALISVSAERSCAAARYGVKYLDLWVGQGISIAIQESTAAPLMTSATSHGGRVITRR